MKILMVARRYPPDVRSGTETVFENLYLRARQTHQVRLLVGFRTSRSMVPEEALAVDLRTGGPILGYGHLQWVAWQEISRFQPDVVLSNSIEVPVTGVPTACIVHDLNFGGSRSGLGASGRTLFYRIKARRLQRVFTVSDTMRRHLIEVGLPGDRIVAIRNGVDVRRFHVRETARDPDRIILSYPSRIIPGKGQHLAIDAVSRLSLAEKAKVELRIVGAAADPVYLDQLRAQAHRQPVTFHIDVDDIVPYYQDADIILFPTLMSEGFGFTAAEGMACGRPVIWSDQQAIREATGGIGIAVPQDDVHALRDAIRKLMNDPAARERLGREGRSFVEGHYDWDAVWLRYERELMGMARL